MHETTVICESSSNRTCDTHSRRIDAWMDPDLQATGGGGGAKRGQRQGQGQQSMHGRRVTSLPKSNEGQTGWELKGARGIAPLPPLEPFMSIRGKFINLLQRATHAV
jgi:hypothetical protein